MQKATPTTKQTRTESFPIALIVSQFNQHVTQALQEGVVAQLVRRGIKEQEISIYKVPGAVEIPLVAKRLAMAGTAKSLIALGAVIRGETSHYELVCTMVSQGCQQVALEYNIPVIFGILTTENEAQAWDRLGGKHGHKGTELADAAISLHELLHQLPK